MQKLTEREIPLADCENCRWNWKRFRSPRQLGFVEEKSHCYMFRGKPGPRCAQFEQAKTCIDYYDIEEKGE